MTTRSAPSLSSSASSDAARRKLWLAALKPPMYAVAVMPILVGSAVAFSQTGQFDWGTFLLFALSAVLLLVWENLSNDVFDAETGIDVNKHHSLVNLTRNRGLIFGLGNLALVLGILGIGAIALVQRDPTVLYLVLACCLLGYLYQGPPFRLGYHGLGEILCFISFGPLAVGAAFYAQTGRWTVVDLFAWHWQLPLLPASIVVGIVTTLVLFCSHFHQVKDDLSAGKRSPIVRLGTRRGAQLLPVACLLVYVVTGLSIVQGGFSWAALALVAAVPSAVKLCRHVLTYHDQPERVSNSKFLAIHFHLWTGLLLSLSLFMGGYGA